MAVRPHSSPCPPASAPCPTGTPRLAPQQPPLGTDTRTLGVGWPRRQRQREPPSTVLTYGPPSICRPRAWPGPGQASCPASAGAATPEKQPHLLSALRSPPGVGLRCARGLGCLGGLGGGGLAGPRPRHVPERRLAQAPSSQPQPGGRGRGHPPRSQLGPFSFGLPPFSTRGICRRPGLTRRFRDFRGPPGPRALFWVEDGASLWEFGLPETCAVFAEPVMGGREPKPKTAWRVPCPACT